MGGLGDGVGQGVTPRWGSAWGWQGLSVVVCACGSVSRHWPSRMRSAAPLGPPTPRIRDLTGAVGWGGHSQTRVAVEAPWAIPAIHPLSRARA